MKLYSYQQEAIDKLKSGNILVGGTGAGKSITALAWFYKKVCNTPYNEVRPLIIITTAKKRDDKEWEKDICKTGLDFSRIQVSVDSWNNIKKYEKVYGACFLFDEQRLVGSGAWVKAFYKIARKNKWLLLTATPADRWTDYMPVFIANGFYKNKTAFNEEHVEWDRFCKFPKIKAFHNTGKLMKFKRMIEVEMEYKSHAEQIHTDIICDYDAILESKVIKERWDIYKDEPIEQASQLCYILRHICNEDRSRVDKVIELLGGLDKVIIFYNFDYELEILRKLCEDFKYVYEYAEWNGHKHEDIPEGPRWIYLVQYTSGCEGWNCTTCDTIIFYSNNYSYRVMKQASGRIDRVNTPFDKLYYYHLTSNSKIDKQIKLALKNKKKFNERKFGERWMTTT